MLNNKKILHGITIAVIIIATIIITRMFDISQRDISNKQNLNVKKLIQSAGLSSQEVHTILRRIK